KDKWLRQKNEDYLTYIHNMDRSEILPGVEMTLDYLRRHGQKIALGSASKNARPILKKVNLLHYFDAIVDGNDVTNAKPDPEVFVQAARLLGISNENSIVFEDSEAGIEAANIAGMTSIGIGDEKVLGHAGYTFPDFNHIDAGFLEMLIRK